MEIRTKVEASGDGWRVVTYDGPGASGWSVGVSFPSEASAQLVANTIERAARGDEG